MQEGTADAPRGARGAATRTRSGRGESSDRWLVLAIARTTAVAAAVVAALSEGEPTGLAWWDVTLRALAAAMFVLASRRLPDWFMVGAAVIAAVATSSSSWFVAAAIGLVLAIGAGALPGRPAWLRVIGAGFVVQALLRIPDIGFFGLPSLIAGVVFVATLVVWYRRSRRRDRRVARWAVGALTVAVAVIGGVGGVVMLGAKADVDRGIDAARAGLSAARGGDPEAVVARLETAAQALESAESTANGIFTQPLRLLPIAGQHHHAVTVATAQGSEIARQASRTTVEADISSVSMSAGSLDLAALQGMQDDLADTVELLEAGIVELDDVQSPWLVPLVADRLEELTDELRDVLPEARIAADAARVVPGLLGEDEPRRYFVAFGSPAESREFGGFVGSWAVLEVDGGSIRQAEFGRTQDLYELTRSQDALPTTEYPLWYVERAQPSMWPQNITGTTDIAVIAAAARDLLDGLDGLDGTGGTGGSASADLDGFVYLDAYALQAILQITGPIRIDGVGHPINGNNAAGFLLDEQFGLENREELKSEQSELFAEAFEDLLDSSLPGPERLGRVLGPVARQGRLQVATFDDDENAFLRSVKLQRSFSWPPDGESAHPVIGVDEALGEAGAEAAGVLPVDGFAVVQTNALQNKLDIYLERDISYDVSVDADGVLTGTATIELTSAVPDDAAEYALGEVLPGTSRLYLSLYTPHLVSEARVDGEVVDTAFIQEYGLTRNEVTVEIPAGETRTVEYEFAGQVDPDADYTVQVWYQPLVNEDTVALSLRAEGDSGSVDSFELTETTIVGFD